MRKQRAPSPQARTLLSTLLSTPDRWWHGYDLSKETGLKSGTLYPILIRLSEQGYLDAEWRAPAQAGRPPRHVYRLTATGRAFAAALETEPVPTSGVKPSKPKRKPA